jgi:hypothetical protein
MVALSIVGGILVGSSICLHQTAGYMVVRDADMGKKKESPWLLGPDERSTDAPLRKHHNE